jgi:hypothetical protein
MPSLAWLLVAIIAGMGAWVVGLPVVRARRERAERDTNTERYLAWRGRASEASRLGSPEPPDERPRLIGAAALAVVAVAALIGFFVAG